MIFFFLNKDNQRNYECQKSKKNLLNGYTSLLIGEIKKLYIKYAKYNRTDNYFNSVFFALENLSTLSKDSKRDFYKANMYSRVEDALINLFDHLYLNFSEFKDLFSQNMSEDDWALYNFNPISLTNNSNKKNNKQNGIFFFVPAFYTSSCDPTTGFCNYFYGNPMKNYTQKKLKEVFNKFDSISWSNDLKKIIFKFDYNNFKAIKGTISKGIDYAKITSWSVYSTDKGFFYDDSMYSSFHNPTQEFIQNSSDSVKFNILNSNNFDLKEICKENIKDIKNIMACFFKSITLRHKHKLSLTEFTDFILSPVMNSNGMFFDTNNKDNISLGLPIDGDSNGAFNIALRLINRLPLI